MNNKQNVLLLSAGRRVGLLQAFRSELKKRSLNSAVIAVDHNPKMSAACQLADYAFALPRVNDAGYMDQLLTLCEQQNIGLVIPTIDTELLALAQARGLFAERGIHLVISDECLVKQCRDKRRTAARIANALTISKAMLPFAGDTGVLRVPELRSSGCSSLHGKRTCEAASIGCTCQHAFYKFYVYVRPENLALDWSRDRIIDEINALGVPCYQGSCSEVYLEKAFDNTGWRPVERLPVAKELGETSLMFLVHPTLTVAEINRTCEVITQVLENAGYDR